MPRPGSIAFAVLIGACQQAQPSLPEAAAPFRPAATTKQLMNEIMEPAANIYWEAVGSVSDRRGTVEFAPQTGAEWTTVRNAATVVTEAGNLLMIAPRAADRDQWMVLSRGLIEAGQRARAAAESKNRTAVFDTGAELYQACVNCHMKYMPGVATPFK